MPRGTQRLGTTKRIYAVAIICIATLAFLTVLFLNVLSQQRALLGEIESRHFDKVADLTAQFSELSANHMRLVDLLSSSNAALDEATVSGVSVRFLRNLNRLVAELERTRPRFAGSPVEAKAYDRLARNLGSYRRATAAAVRLASTNINTAKRRLRGANRSYRRISEEFEALITSSREGAHRSINRQIRNFDARTYQFSAGVTLIIALVTILAIVMLRKVMRDITGITGAMSELTTGRTDVHIPGLERRDEIGEMARATAVFRSNIEQLESMAGLEEREKKLQAEVAELIETKKEHDRQLAELNASAIDLAEARDAAEAANRAKSELLASISYDIRTPMNGLMGMAGLFRDTGLSKDQRDYVDGIRQSGEILLSVINDLLDYSKLEGGQIELDAAEFDLIDVVEGLPSTVWPDPAKANADLLFYVSQDVPQFLIGDRERLGQALANMLATAVKGTAAGQISFEISVDHREEQHAMLRFDVVDHADIVMPQDVSEHVAHNWTAEGDRAGSTARTLPMAITTHVAGLMDGAAGSERADGDASRHWLTVELGIVENATDEWRARTPQLFDKRALIVDGSAAAGDILRRQMSEWGLSAEHANNGRAALARMARADADQTPYDVVVINSALPDMLGSAFVRAARSAGGSGDVRLILNVASGETPDQPLGTLGVNALVRRPLTPTMLLGACLGALAAQAAPAMDSPGDPDTAPVPDEAAVSKAEETRRLRILLADDNQMNQKVVTAMFGSTEHHIDVVGNGIEALDAVKTTPYDIVLMDIQMPDMDGVTATREIRLLPDDTANIPIIALTANAMEGDREMYLESGMDDYVSKPIDREKLMTAIDRQTRAAAPGAGDEQPAAGPREPEDEPEADTQNDGSQGPTESMTGS